MIDKTIKNIKKYFNTLEGTLTAKISVKNILQGFGGNNYSKNSKYIKKFFVFSMYKRDRYKNG